VKEENSRLKNVIINKDNENHTLK
jgi:hypothetical protein